MYGDLTAIKFNSVGHPEDVVKIDEIFRRYIEINGTVDGFEEYVNSGFRNGNEIEYEECMNYFIAFFNDEEFDWCVLQTKDKEYAIRVFEDLSAPPGWNMELRATREPIETYRTYEVLGYDHTQFEMEG